MNRNNIKYYIGMDVGSTTVKAVVTDTVGRKIIWQDYERHESKQQEKVLDFLKRMDTEVGIKGNNSRIFITGSGGNSMAPYLGAKFVQEVNAVCLSVEKMYPDCGSVVELGGQDAKIIIFQEDPETRTKRKIPTMNDKCAGGTGAVIDKINSKLMIPPEQLCNMGYEGIRLHPVAAKCGVFAETDINSLQKLGVPGKELMASLFEAIIQQNLSVLTRGHTLRPRVLLLGGPNTYIKGMQECWKANIMKLWEERKYPLPLKARADELIHVPVNAEYFAAIGSVEYGRAEDQGLGIYLGWERLEEYLHNERNHNKKRFGVNHGLSRSHKELQAFKEKFNVPSFEPEVFQRGEKVKAWVGIDGGSTSTKAVLIDCNKNVICKAYQLSKGDPIKDTIEILDKLRLHIESQGAVLEIMGVGTTGYAKDILKDVLSADVALVETVAHTQSALRYYNEVDLICDVGGQDIKLIILRNGRVVDFKLNTQCSAGNGYFLQSSAESFGYRVEDYADVAFEAEAIPRFGYGCAVFLQSDIVNFQRQGWKPQEIMAGLANILPKNIWLYVAQIPNLTKLGRNFILQGGTQRNLAAVKAQVDYIESRFKGKGITPNIKVHRHCGECGAIGTALEALRMYEKGHRTRFIGFDAVSSITYVTSHSEETRCHFCPNKCLRTFIDVNNSHTPGSTSNGISPNNPADAGAKRIIIATCEKGSVESLAAMRNIRKNIDSLKEDNPDLSRNASIEAFSSQKPATVAEPLPRIPIGKRQKTRVALVKRRPSLTIGIPRVLNIYSLAPWFNTYFESLGLKTENIIYSDYTTERLYREGAKRGAIDPCFPSKLGIPHIHNLIFKINPRKNLDIIFFPMVDCLASPLRHTLGSRACPTVATTPEATKAAFIKEKDLFRENDIIFLNTFLNLSESGLAERQMYDEFNGLIGLSKLENRRAVESAYNALDNYGNSLRQKGRKTIEKIIREGRVGIVMLGRPYHNDPGINHGILEELQKKGYPILTQESLPRDKETLQTLFGEDIASGVISDAMDISDVWKNSFSENSNLKIWAAKYTARHPNLVALELSSFKCGHDAPIYTMVQEIVERSGTPYFCFKDIDENKPSGSIKIRVETIDYFLRRYAESLKSRIHTSATSEEKTKRIESISGANRDNIFNTSDTSPSF